MPFRLKLFLIAMLYGVTLASALSNTLVLGLSLALGWPAGRALPLALTSWGVLLWLHYRMGWPPFRHPSG